MSKKSAWPECLGMSLETAKAHIAKEFTGVIDVCGNDMGYPCDYYHNRLKIIVKNYRMEETPDGDVNIVSGTVCDVPSIG